MESCVLKETSSNPKSGTTPNTGRNNRLILVSLIILPVFRVVPLFGLLHVFEARLILVSLASKTYVFGDKVTKY